MVHDTGLQADALGAQLAEATAAAEGHKASRLALKAADSAKTEAGPFPMLAICLYHRLHIVVVQS